MNVLQEKSPLTMVGLMTGTSMDGLDICVAEVELAEASKSANVVKAGSIPYPRMIRTEVEACLSGNAGVISRTHFSLGKFMAEQTVAFLEMNRLGSVDAVGMHGQTVHHVSGEASLQIGEPSFLAQALGVPVISDFRAADIAAGGTGAPLIPIVDKWLLQSANEAVICLNLGGVANITYLPPRDTGESVLGFDTGPGMALLDEASVELTGKNFDDDGAAAQSGMADDESVEDWLSHRFITAPPPKSTGRDEFGTAWLADNIPEMPAWKVNDLLATLSLFTARSVAVNCRHHLPLDRVHKLIVSGGGIYHKPLMNHLKTEFSPVTVITSADLGIDPFIKEALGFAMLGAAHLKGIPGNLPSVTGASRAVVLGKLTL